MESTRELLSCSSNVFIDEFASQCSMYSSSFLDKKSWRTVQESVRTILTILPTLLNIVLCRLWCHHLRESDVKRFLIEHFLIALPLICNLTVTNKYNDIYCGFAIAIIIISLWRSIAWSNAKNCTYEVGKRPAVFTLLRALIYIGTCATILAVDFVQFPREFTKSRDFGATGMDVGIGAFVLTMGLVSNRAKNLSDLRRLPKIVGPLLTLGIVRTVVITIINYHQDEHEYGQHLNAFFILGFTKLFGTLCSLIVPSDIWLLPLSLGLLIAHQTIHQLGLSVYVMEYQARYKSLFIANREGLSALPGCTALYLLSIYFAKWYMSQQKLTYKEMLNKLFIMLIIAIFGWWLVINCAYTIGIARVTFNAGYVIWTFTVCETLMLIFTFLFEFAFRIPPVAPTKEHVGDQVVAKEKQPLVAKEIPVKLPVYVEIVNMNGLTYFMIANLLTGLVNMSLDTKVQNDASCVLILMLYSFANACFVYILYRGKIRLA